MLLFVLKTFRLCNQVFVERIKTFMGLRRGQGNPSHRVHRVGRNHNRELSFRHASCFLWIWIVYRKCLLTRCLHLDLWLRRLVPKPYQGGKSRFLIPNKVVNLATQYSTSLAEDKDWDFPSVFIDYELSELMCKAEFDNTNIKLNKIW